MNTSATICFGNLLRIAVFIGWIFYFVSDASAVIFYSTGDPSFNTTEPSGDLANSGWEYQGLWGDYLGTVIAPQYFITAEHFGGSVGDKFILNGKVFITTDFFDDPLTDLRLWRINGTFPGFARINTNHNEVGMNVVIFGRGTLRGAQVTTRTTNFFGVVTSKNHGWEWGSSDGVMRWGENRVDAVVDASAAGYMGIGELLKCEFTASAGINECHLSTGDSGGALFMRDGNSWKLAGISYASDGTYRTTKDGGSFKAAIFDEGGLFQQQGTNWMRQPDLPFDQPGSFYATRISSRAEWIHSVVSAAIPEDIPSVQSAPVGTGLFYDTAASIDVENRLITLPIPAGQMFYRLRSLTAPRRITSIQVQGDRIVLEYE